MPKSPQKRLKYLKFYCNELYASQSTSSVTAIQAAKRLCLYRDGPSIPPSLGAREREEREGRGGQGRKGKWGPGREGPGDLALRANLVSDIDLL